MPICQLSLRFRRTSPRPVSDKPINPNVAGSGAAETVPAVLTDTSPVLPLFPWISDAKGNYIVD